MVELTVAWSGVWSGVEWWRGAVTAPPATVTVCMCVVYVPSAGTGPCTVLDDDGSMDGAYLDIAFVVYT
jgi:anti-sigma-K factor RskA